MHELLSVLRIRNEEGSGCFDSAEEVVHTSIASAAMLKTGRTSEIRKCDDPSGSIRMRRRMSGEVQKCSRGDSLYAESEKRS